MKRTISLLLCAAIGTILGVLLANAGTVVCSTVTYNGADEAGFAAAALPEAGVWAFDAVVISTPLTTSRLDSFKIHLDQMGADGYSRYTIPNSTFTASSYCTLLTGGKCLYSIFPGVYEGGNVRCSWEITTGSATVKVTARKVAP